MGQINASLPVAVSMGDPAGIGPDIVVLAASLAHQLPAFVCLGDPDVLRERARLLGQPLSIAITDRDLLGSVYRPGVVPVLPVPCAAPVHAGRPDPANGPAVIEAIEIAVRLTGEGRCAAVVTNPIAKDVLKSAGFAHLGHTEFLGELAVRRWNTRVRPVMMLASPELKVVPVTVHVPLSAVPALITRELIEQTARTTAKALAADFDIAQPRIAVCGLNPHAGESGLLGTEEQAVIEPAIEALRAEGLSITGPHPADTLFHAAARRRYDVVLAMYHDQGLVPLKTLAFDHGVNVTLGLPFVRTSPDHGTAFSLAGSGEASPASFIAALRLAAEIAGRRAAGQVA